MVFLTLAKINSGYWRSKIFVAIIISIFGERLIEVIALSRGAMRKRQECAFRKQQQQSPLYVKDWLKRREILSLLQEAAKQ